MSTADAAGLDAWTQELFVRCGANIDHARDISGALVRTSLRGIDSHGVALIPTYVRLLQSAISNVDPRITVARRASAINVDGDRGLGQVVGAAAVRAAVDVARGNGLAMVLIRDTGHLGALGHFALTIAELGLVGLVMQNTPLVMSLVGSTSRAIGNNPMAFGAPIADRVPLVFDIASSEAAFGKVIEANRRGEAIPKGWALDRNGQATRDSTAALDGMLVPFGGVKGVCLTMMVEVSRAASVV